MESALDLRCRLIVFDERQRVDLVLQILIYHHRLYFFIRDRLVYVSEGELGRGMVLQPCLVIFRGTLAILEVSGYGHLREIAEVLQQHKHVRTDNFIEFFLLFIRLVVFSFLLFILLAVFSPLLPVRLDLVFA